MGKRTSYEPGTFSWIELSTTDTEGAKQFYGKLFGWEPDDNPIPEERGRWRLHDAEARRRDRRRDLRAVQPISAMPGIPPNWFSYITVADADAAAARAKELGGSVHAGPFDVMDAGPDGRHRRSDRRRVRGLAGA